MLGYLGGFLEEGRPQSMARLCAFMLTLSCCVVAVLGAWQKWDSSMIVLALGGSGVGSLMSRKRGTPDTAIPPARTFDGPSMAHPGGDANPS